LTDVLKVGTGKSEKRGRMTTQGQNRSKIFYGWWVVLASGIGLFLCYGPILTFTFSVFFNSLVHEFNWTRGEISLAYSLSMLAFGVAQPFVGRLVDKLGSRKVILPSVLIFGTSFASLYFLSSRVGHFYAVYIAMGLVGGGTTSMVYFKVLTRWFSRKRGLVIGLALAGNGLSAFFMPSLAQALIDWAGWREAYALIGLMVIGITLPVVMLLLEEFPERRGLLPDGDTDASTQTSDDNPKQQQEKGGLSALRTPAFWFMAPAFLLMSMSLVGTLTHLVPMLTDRGILQQSAAFAASVLGGATLIGRIGIGYLLDRFQAPRVAMSLFIAAAVGVFILLTGAAGILAFVGAFLVGIGSSFDSVIPYMVSRFFSLPAFAETYGYVVAVNVVGWMAGPLIMGVSFDQIGSYDWVLVGFLVCMLTAATLMFLLGSYYRDGARRSKSER
jgi:MFS family permease